MTSPAIKPPASNLLRKRVAVSETVACSALLVLAVACAAVLLAQPRPLLPREPPNLSLPAAEVRSVIESDTRAARSAPGGEQVQALEALVLEHGRAEARGVEDADLHQQRLVDLARDYEALVAAVSEPVAMRLRARAVQRLEAALAGELAMDEAKALLGAFPTVLARELASRNKEIVAPQFVVRTLFKARWNILHGLAAAHAFERVERRAFHGWEALHAERVPLPRRVQAVHDYAAAGGEDVEEALGVLLFKAGNQDGAATALEAARRRRATLRLGNYALGAKTAAGMHD